MRTIAFLAASLLSASIGLSDAPCSAGEPPAAGNAVSVPAPAPPAESEGMVLGFRAIAGPTLFISDSNRDRDSNDYLNLGAGLLVGWRTGRMVGGLELAFTHTNEALSFGQFANTSVTNIIAYLTLQSVLARSSNRTLELVAEGKLGLGTRRELVDYTWKTDLTERNPVGAYRFSSGVRYWVAPKFAIGLMVGVGGNVPVDQKDNHELAIDVSPGIMGAWGGAAPAPTKSAPVVSDSVSANAPQGPMKPGRTAFGLRLIGEFRALGARANPTVNLGGGLLLGGRVASTVLGVELSGMSAVVAQDNDGDWEDAPSVTDFLASPTVLGAIRASESSPTEMVFGGQLGIGLRRTSDSEGIDAGENSYTLTTRRFYALFAYRLSLGMRYWSRPNLAVGVRFGAGGNVVLDDGASHELVLDVSPEIMARF